MVCILGRGICNILRYLVFKPYLETTVVEHNFSHSFLFLFSGKPCKAFCTVVAPPVVRWHECGGVCCGECLDSVLARGTSYWTSRPPAIRSSSPSRRERRSFCCSIGHPQRSFQHWSVRMDGLQCSRLVCVYSNPSVLQLRINGTDQLHLPLNPSSELMHEMYMWV